MPSSRDYRADLFRGVALLTIFANHFNISALNTEWAIFKLTPSNFTYFSGAEVFVFLSGYVFGIVYRKVYLRNGWRASYKKAAWRAWDLYRANLVTLSVTLALCASFVNHGLLDSLDFFPALGAFFNSPLESLPAILSMEAALRYFEILNLYILLLLFVPLFLNVAHSAPLFLVGGSVFVYSLALNGVLVNPVASFDPWQWQFHFVLGLLAGWYQPTVPRSLLLIGASSLLLVVGMLDVYLIPRLVNLGWLSPDSVLVVSGPLEGKGGPLAALQFLGAIYLVHCFVPRAGAVYDRWFVRPLVVAGQHSLPVFCVGIVLTYGGSLLTRSVVTSPVGTLGLLVGGLALSIGTGYLVRWNQKRERSSPVPATVPVPVVTASNGTAAESLVSSGTPVNRRASDR